MFQNKFLRFYKTLKAGYLNLSDNKSYALSYLQERQISFLWKWFLTLFNSVDSERVALVGPDCACAEWLLINGASVRFKGHNNFLSDYNELIHLEEINASVLKIEDIYAREASLTEAGFNHFIGCNHVNKITFIFCLHLTDSALFKLKYVKDTLQFLELTSCFNIEDRGLYAICNLSNLKTLKLADLVSVVNKDACEEALRKALPQCKIDFQK